MLKMVLSFVIACSVALLTFVITMYNLPSNYVEAQIGTPINRFMSPYLMQSWSLFAPNPGPFSTDATFRFAYQDSMGVRKVSRWFDGDSIFPVSYNGNPLNKLGLEREIYYGEVLLATNDIHKLRAFVKKGVSSIEHPVPLVDLPGPLIAVERLAMSMEPALTGDISRAPFSVQIAITEIGNEDFGKKFSVERLAAVHAPTATLVIPWISGTSVTPFFEGIQ